MALYPAGPQDVQGDQGHVHRVRYHGSNFVVGSGNCGYSGNLLFAGNGLAHLFDGLNRSVGGFSHALSQADGIRAFRCADDLRIAESCRSLRVALFMAEDILISRDGDELVLALIYDSGSVLSAL